MMRIPDIIARKRDGNSLSEEELQFVISKIVNKEVDQCQLGALLMAIYLKGMTNNETVALTKTMMSSGEVFSWPDEWKNIVADKHSTGGVGDKISLVLAPALAACGLKVPMISGRGLGICAGTLDKLEAIPGFRVSCPKETILECLDKVGCCIVGQTENIVPADKLMYRCRDVTSTIDNISLIVSSIISKKAAEGLASLVLDVKFGSAAFMKTEKEAERLASLLVSTAKGIGIDTTALITAMDWPVGRCIGAALEVSEAVEGLQGILADDFKELILTLGARLLLQSKIVTSIKEGSDMLLEKITNGEAREKFIQMLICQGVNEWTATTLLQPGKAWCVLPKAKFTHRLIYNGDSGYIHDIRAVDLGEFCSRLGFGRNSAEDTINYAVGIQLNAHIGSSIKTGTEWLTIHHDNELSSSEIEALNKAVVVKPDPFPKEALKRIFQVLQ